jgi:hypothetical protein
VYGLARLVDFNQVGIIKRLFDKVKLYAVGLPKIHNI